MTLAPDICWGARRFELHIEAGSAVAVAYPNSKTPRRFWENTVKTRHLRPREMRLEPARCTGCGLCEELSPDILHVGLIAVNTDTLDAMAICPTGAIVWHEEAAGAISEIPFVVRAPTPHDRQTEAAEFVTEPDRAEADRKNRR